MRNRARVKTLHRKHRPAPDMPLVVELWDDGYHHDGKIFASKDELMAMVPAHTYGTTPNLVVYDLRDNAPDLPEYQDFPVEYGGGPEGMIAWNPLERLWYEQVEANVRAAHPDEDFKVMTMCMSQGAAREWQRLLEQQGRWSWDRYGRHVEKARQWAIEAGFEDYEPDVPVTSPTVSGRSVTT